MNKQHMIAPSILAADFANLQRDIEMINKSEADYLHVDVMDGRFVPNISFGQAIVKTMGQYSAKPMDVHLMIEEPERYVSEFAEAGAHIITVHAEATRHLHRLIQQIKALGVKAGVALNPHTPVSQVFEVLEDLDLVCLMSVNPGFGGQKFIYNTIAKIKSLREEADSRNLDILIEIDGGVGLQNAEVLLHAGANLLVAGSSVFASPDPIKTVSQLKAISLHTTLN